MQTTICLLGLFASPVFSQGLGDNLVAADNGAVDVNVALPDQAVDQATEESPSDAEEVASPADNGEEIEGEEEFDPAEIEQEISYELQNTINSRVVSEFSTFDVNKDGYLSKEEFLRARVAIESLLAELGSDSEDPRELYEVSQEVSELATDLQGLSEEFQAADFNDDGRVDVAEFTAHYTFSSGEIIDEEDFSEAVLEEESEEVDGIIDEE